MGRSFLGEFEQMVLLTIMRLGDQPYGVPIIRELEARTGRAVQRGALYTTLERLERKGLVRSQLGEPSPQRGGRGKRYFAVTGEGAKALGESRQALLNLWEGLEGELETS